MDQKVVELDKVSLTFSPINRTSLIFGGWASSKIVKAKPFLALDSLTFSINRGKKVGIIGRNGAGKTTLMRLIAGIYGPTSGSIKVNSKSTSLLTLGAGFDLNASGFENIYLGSMLNGLSKKQIDVILPDIISFSDLSDHIHYQLKTYSTGMRARLAFSVAMYCRPEVLLLDEVLSVGDFEFQKKSRNAMEELIQDGNRTVIISSHSMDTIKDICDEVIWLDSGKMVQMGDQKR